MAAEVGALCVGLGKIQQLAGKLNRCVQNGEDQQQEHDEPRLSMHGPASCVPQTCVLGFSGRPSLRPELSRVRILRLAGAC